jgi:hypothetical protein
MAVGKNERLIAAQEVVSTASKSCFIKSLVLETVPNILSSVVWFMYDVLVARPLRAFYFEGPIWHNQPPEEICYELTGVEARHWVSSPENIARCQMEMERRFQSWDRTAMTIMHFTLLTFVVIKLICCCKCGRPEWTDDRHCARQCNCNFGHNSDEARLVTREELRDMLRTAMRDQSTPKVQ